LSIGDLDIVGLPGEFTTMSGRRVRNAVNSIKGGTTIVAGLANSYINYVATPEEYDALEYEGGATLYGRYTLPAVVNAYEEIARHMMNVRLQILLTSTQDYLT